MPNFPSDFRFPTESILDIIDDIIGFVLFFWIVMRPQFFAYSMLLSFLYFGDSTAGGIDLKENAKAELMPDGNWRDPLPSAEEIKKLLEITKKNMVAFSAGSFEMGDWGSEVNKGGLPFDGNYDSKPLHKVQLSAFSIGKYPVTYAEFDIFTAALRLPRINQDEIAQHYRKPNNPAGVTWQGAKDYCEWLSKQTGEPYDLGTEAQWEYAARSGGKRYLYPTSNGEYLEGINTPSFAQRKAAGGIVEVGSFPPNAAGIYNFSAGINEWVNDWYDAKYYEHSPLQDPKGPVGGDFHVKRGFAGSDLSEMTIKRWGSMKYVQAKTWTKFGEHKVDNREIEYTKYSYLADTSFRCVLNR